MLVTDLPVSDASDSEDFVWRDFENDPVQLHLLCLEASNIALLTLFFIFKRAIQQVKALLKLKGRF